MLNAAISTLPFRLVKSLNRRHKYVFFLLLDMGLVALSVMAALSVNPLPATAPEPDLVLLLALPYLTILAGAILALLGLPALQLADFDANATARVMSVSLLLSIGATALGSLFGHVPPIATIVMFGTGVFLAITMSRVVLLQVVLAVYRRGGTVTRVLIYGAGTTGMQLVQALRAHRSIQAVAFVDDNAALHGLTISGLPVLAPTRIAEVVAQRRIDRVLLSVPSLSPPKQARIARKLQKLGLEVQLLPSFSQLIGTETLLDKLERVKPHMFLNRDEVDGPLAVGEESYRDRSVLVSGAGGSIGSELCRQLVECRPRKLILFEQSEFALFSVDQELRTLATEAGVEIVPVLGSVTDARQVRKTLDTHAVEVILHTAAYKHVTLVQRNPLPGLANNVLGTQVIAAEALAAGVARFTLISSDKAVRPKGVMGASKRLAEMVIQDVASRVPEGEGPIFSMVRFGNVLGSSGSVVPIFQDQIRRGGPVTVTHPRVTRYFMTIQEAARLVLKAGSMAEGGEVFLLDMGEPVRIHDLAVQAIEAAGYAVQDEANPQGDIAVAFIGLRDGEKLEEELFLDGSERPTAHRKIFRVRERQLSEFEMADTLRTLRTAMAEGDDDAALSMLAKRLPSFGAGVDDVASAADIGQSPTPI